MSTTDRRSIGDILISVVIPCYNEEDVLEELYRRVEEAAAGWGADFEVLTVDDGSTDATWDILSGFASRNSRWKALRLSRNFGHQTALWAGLCNAEGGVVAVLDADLQDPPEVVPKLLEKWSEGFDTVYAIRTKRKEGPLKKAAYLAYYRVLACMSEVDIPLDTGDFCVMDRRVVDALTSISEPDPFIRGLRAWLGFKQIGVAYERHQRAAGEVKYTFAKLIRLGMNGIISFSTRPLRLATYFGFFVSLLAFLGAVFTLVQRVFASSFVALGLAPAPGFATIVIAILFLGGVQLVCLGILGEYVARVYESVKGRPQYVLSETRGMQPTRVLDIDTNQKNVA
ncbi:MAG: glycosyltransferase family 2 protein [Planctomycetota bacterium]